MAKFFIVIVLEKISLFSPYGQEKQQQAVTLSMYMWVCECSFKTGLKNVELSCDQVVKPCKQAQWWDHLLQGITQTVHQLQIYLNYLQCTYLWATVVYNTIAYVQTKPKTVKSIQ